MYVCVGECVYVCMGECVYVCVGMCVSVCISKPKQAHQHLIISTPTLPIGLNLLIDYKLMYSNACITKGVCGEVYVVCVCVCVCACVCVCVWHVYGMCGVCTCEVAHWDTKVFSCASSSLAQNTK